MKSAPAIPATVNVSENVGITSPIASKLDKTMTVDSMRKAMPLGNSPLMNAKESKGSKARKDEEKKRKRRKEKEAKEKQLKKKKKVEKKMESR